MAPKSRASAAAPSTATTPRTPTSSSASGSTAPSSLKASSTSFTSSSTSSAAVQSSNSPQVVVQQLWNNYVDKTPQRTKLIDAFLGFLLVVGVVQFVYCVLAGNYPFNAFLAGFGATVGQFVLTASLRIQTNPENKSEFKSISQERAFADYVLGSLILHFFCVNFVN